MKTTITLTEKLPIVFAITLSSAALFSCQKEVYNNYIPPEENIKDSIAALSYNEDGCCDVLIDTIRIPSDTIGWEGNRFYVLGTFEDKCTGHINQNVYMGPAGFSFMKIGEEYCNPYHY